MPSKLRKKAVTSKQKGSQKRRAGRTQIALRAYEIFLGRGAGDGHDLEDWLQAEAELASRRN